MTEKKSTESWVPWPWAGKVAVITDRSSVMEPFFSKEVNELLAANKGMAPDLILLDSFNRLPETIGSYAEKDVQATIKATQFWVDQERREAYEEAMAVITYYACLTWLVRKPYSAVVSR